MVGCRSAGGGGLPVAVYASSAPARAVVGVVDYAIDYRGEVFGDADDKPAGREFVGAEMHGAAGADLHRRRPDPAEGIHDTLDRRLVDARARIALAALSAAGALVNGRAVHQIVDVLVGESRGDGDGADDAVASLAAVSGSATASIIESEIPWHARSWKGTLAPRRVRRWLRLRSPPRLVCRRRREELRS